ncbi:MAG: CapA family protein [Bacillota bacterium]|nr:CapA family protein [Bacillota bacterium]
MKKKKAINKSKTGKNGRTGKEGGSPLHVFLITLCSVLGAGTVLLLVLKLRPVFGVDGSENVKEASVTMQGDEKTEAERFSLLWESIPEESRKEAALEESETRYGAILADEAYMKANRIIPWEGNSGEEVTLGFVGDILFDDEYAVMANLLRRGASIENGVSEEMLAQLQGVDILVANNEFPFTDRGTPTEGKAYTFRADTGTVDYLHDLGVDVAVLANNHIYDFGETGLLDTLDTLSGAGIPFVGAGENLKEASDPIYFIINDIKIAVVAATQIERLDNPDTKGATETSAGVFRCWNPEKLYETVSMAKENSDFVIVYIHWGTENVTEPDWAQLEQAPKLAQAGADLIIGDHPHCLQGITYYEDIPVIYSLGNFWFNSKTVDTGMVQITLDQDGLKEFRFVPAIQSDCRVDLAYGEDADRILSMMRTLSPNVSIDEEGRVSKN